MNTNNVSDQDMERPIMTINDKQELEIRMEARKFREEYVEAREKVRSQGYESLSSYEKMVLEKGDDYLNG